MLKVEKFMTHQCYSSHLIKLLNRVKHVYPKGVYLIFFVLLLSAFIWLTQDSEKKVVIFSANFSVRYMFYLPFTVSLWKNLGVIPVVVLIGEKNDFQNHLQIKETIKMLEEMNVYILYFKPKLLSSVTFSQVVRLFGAVLPLQNYLNSDNTIIITTDADLALFNLSNHIPNLKNGKTIHLYDSNCYTNLSRPIKVPPMRGNYTVKQFLISTIAATKKTWKSIMNFENNVYTIEEIEQYIVKEFGTDFFHPNDSLNIYQENIKNIGPDIWYSDQSIFGYKYDEWIKNFIPYKRIRQNDLSWKGYCPECHSLNISLSTLGKMLCQICSRPHEGNSKRYGVYSCNSCALFFRRSVNLRKNYVCIGNGDCLKESPLLGIQCRGCRYRKCLEIGMSVPEMSKNQKVSPKVAQPKTPVSPEIHESSTASLNDEANKLNEEKAKTLYYLLDTVIDFPHLLESYLNGENENLAKIYFDTVISSSTTETINYFVSLFEKYPITFDELSTVCHICVCKIEYYWLSEAQQTKIKGLQKAGYIKTGEKNSDESRFNELKTFSNHAMNIFNALFSY